MDSLGKIVSQARLKRGESLKVMARAIGCSEAFARHIEASRTVPISERLISAIRKRYRLSKLDLENAWRSRNRIGRAYYQSYRRKHSA